MSQNVCEICNIHCSSAAFLAEHLNGKKHAAAVEEAERLLEISQRSVFLSNFHSRVEVEDVLKALQDFGELERVLLDKNNFTYAIVEFRKTDEAQRLLQSIKKLKIGDNLVNVRERKVDFTNLQLDKLTLNSIDIENLQNVSITEQINLLVTKFGLDLEEISERKEFANVLKEFLQKYFFDFVEVRVFGSSSTGLAFFNADLDLNFHIKAERESSSIVYECNEVSLSENKNNQFDVASILENPYTKAKFLELSKSDRAHLLTKLINEFRKESGIQMQITPALDARCPVVRFISKLSLKLKKRLILSCELSINNLLSEKKAGLIKDVIDADCSGNLQKFFFIIKLWAHCSGLFTSPDKKQSKSNWNSYTILLLAVSFLQSKQLIELSNCFLSCELEGWKIKYLIKKIDLSNCNVAQFLKAFFIFLYNSVRHSNVHSIYDGKLFSKSEFEQKYLSKISDLDPIKKFKFALANIQDPIELSHNVASNVSRNALVRFRKALMFSIFALKKQNDDDISCIFQLDSLETKFVATTETNFEHNLEQKKSGNILTIDLGGTLLSSSVIFEAFSSLLNNVLLIDQVEEPLAKRSRKDSLKPPASFLNSKIDDEELLCDSCVLQFKISFPTWLGRRGVRRKLAAELRENLTPLLIEKEVSKKLKTSVKADNKPFTFDVQLYTVETQKDEENENVESSSTSFMNSSDNASNRELHAIFQLKPNISNETTNLTKFRDLFHFLLTFLTKYLPLILENKSEFVNVNKKNLQENSLNSIDCIKSKLKSFNSDQQIETMEV